ncbi:MAG: hypothetical protein MJA83_07700 [Gammaproteobacteria bacterium]|nr:hypothetical protein [Gammaproteobacteria bacterium]
MSDKPKLTEAKVIRLDPGHAYVMVVCSGELDMGRRARDRYLEQLSKWSKALADRAGCELHPIVFEAATRVEFIEIPPHFNRMMQMVMVDSFCRLLEFVLRMEHR